MNIKQQKCYKLLDKSLENLFYNQEEFDIAEFNLKILQIKFKLLHFISIFLLHLPGITGFSNSSRSNLHIPPFIRQVYFIKTFLVKLFFQKSQPL